MSDVIIIHTFPAGFGLPTTGPFSLKLALALRLANIPYEFRPTANLSASPKRKIPWIELGERKMADTALIMRWLKQTRGVDLERGLTPVERARGSALRAMLEERWHQVYEIELILDPEGAGAALAPLQDHFRMHLYERGMLRHSREEIIAFGKADLDDTAALLEGRSWSVVDHPTLTDCSVWGMLAPAIYAPFPTPCMSHARTLPSLVAFVERARAQFFPEIAPSNAAAKLGLAPAA